jgi:hypothetical protein
MQPRVIQALAVVALMTPVVLSVCVAGPDILIEEVEGPPAWELVSALSSQPPGAVAREVHVCLPLNSGTLAGAL